MRRVGMPLIDSSTRIGGGLNQRLLLPSQTSGGNTVVAAWNNRGLHVAIIIIASFSQVRMVRAGS
jgi:hypothetical protein